MSADSTGAQEDADILGRSRRRMPSAAACVPDRDPQTVAIIGAAMEVHRELSSGFLEGVYHDAFQQELLLKNIPFSREFPVPITYKGVPIGTPSVPTSFVSSLSWWS